MICTVREIRARLGKIMESMMCDEIQDIYTKVSTDFPEKVMAKYSDEADNLVNELSEHLFEQDHWIATITAKQPEVFFTFFMRYHLLTNYFANHNQDSPANMPKDDKKFFIVLLTDFWKFSTDYQ